LENKIGGIAKREDFWRANLRKLCALIWGQSSETLRAHVEA